MIQILVNTAFESDLYRCGCQCAEYTSAAGDVWRLSEASPLPPRPLLPRSFVCSAAVGAYQ